MANSIEFNYIQVIDKNDYVKKQKGKIYTCIYPYIRCDLSSIPESGSEQFHKDAYVGR